VWSISENHRDPAGSGIRKPVPSYGETLRKVADSEDAR
jgi:hypothetical protein